jgi:hypothetical protein
MRHSVRFRACRIGSPRSVNLERVFGLAAGELRGFDVFNALTSRTCRRQALLICNRARRAAYDLQWIAINLLQNCHVNLQTCGL